MLPSERDEHLSAFDVSRVVRDPCHHVGRDAGRAQVRLKPDPTFSQSVRLKPDPTPGQSRFNERV
jgi:hypothetical protein